MRIDLVTLILGILIILAMAMTLAFGKRHGRHGYGLATPAADRVCESGPEHRRFARLEPASGECA